MTRVVRKVTCVKAGIDGFLQTSERRRGGEPETRERIAGDDERSYEDDQCRDKLMASGQRTIQSVSQSIS